MLSDQVNRSQLVIVSIFISPVYDFLNDHGRERVVSLIDIDLLQKVIQLVLRRKALCPERGAWGLNY